MGRVFGKGLGDLGSIPGHVVPKTLKMVLDISLLNTQQYKVRIKGKVEQSTEKSISLSLSLSLSLAHGKSVRQGSGRPGFNPRSRRSKDFKNGT